jgi:hypothetical protein
MADKRLVPGHSVISEYLSDGMIVTAYLKVLKAVRSAPDADQKLLDQFSRIVSAIGQLRRQPCVLKLIAQSHLAHHAAHQGHAAPRGNLAVSKTKLKGLAHVSVPYDQDATTGIATMPIFS